MLHADLGGILDLVIIGAHGGGQRRSRHRTGHADLALAAGLGAGDGGILLVERADGRGGEEETLQRFLVVRVAVIFVEIAGHGRDDAGRAIGRCGDDAAAGGVFLVHRHRPQIDPVHRGEGILFRADRIGQDIAMHLRRPPLDAQPAGQHAVLGEAAVDTILHRPPQALNAGADRVLGQEGALVCQHDAVDGQPLALADLQQFGRGVEGEGLALLYVSRRIAPGLVLVDHEAAADRVPDLLAHDIAMRVIGKEFHRVGVEGQAHIAAEIQIGLFLESDFPAIGQFQRLLAADAGQPVRNRVRIDLGRIAALQAQQHRRIGAMAQPGQGERSVELGLQARDRGAIGQAALDKDFRRLHRSDRMRTGGTDTDLEQVEDTEMHGANSLKPLRG